MTVNANSTGRDSARRYWMILLGVSLTVLAGQAAYLLYLHEKPAFTAPGSRPAHSAQPPARPAPSGFGPLAGFQDPWSDPWQRDVFAELSRMQSEVDRLFEETLARMRSHRDFLMMGAGPRSSLSDEGDHYVVTVETGGELSEVKVEVKDDVLAFSARREAASPVQHQGGLVLTRSSGTGTIHQSIRFPAPVDPSSLRTEYKAGAIRVEVKKHR